jgi:hypothetical protein
MNLSQIRQKMTLWHVALAATIALALTARFLPGERTIDDAFITFRYSRNVLAGNGFVYNPGERVQGTTTPFYTLLMAGEKALLPNVGFSKLAIVTNALADAATIAVLALLCRRTLQAPWLGIACGLLWALMPMSVTFAIGGMETSVYILLLVLTLSTYAAGHTLWGALLCALATLTRPDALLVAVPLFVHMLWHRRRIPWREGIAYLLALAPWVLFATFYFGSPLANSVVAKTAAYRLGPFSALVRLIQHYATPFFEHRILGTRWVAVGSILYLFLSWIGGLAMIRRESRLVPWVVYPWFYLVAFSVSNPLIFRWYMAPILPMYVLCIAYGVRQIGWDVVSALQARWPAASLAGRILGSALLLIALGFLVNAWTLHPDHGPARPAPEMAWFKLEQLYRQVTSDLVASEPVTAETRIAAGDIGVVGFVSGARILDTLGLISPGSTAYYPLPDAAHATTYAVSTDLILDKQPDYIVLLEVYLRYTLARSDAFAAQYELIHKWPTDIYESDGMLVYRRIRQ